jgi:hypothetical protein
MRFEGYDDELPDEEEVIDEFLGDNPRARELRLMRAALEQRLAVMQRDNDRAVNERERSLLQPKLAELRKQIAAIHQEEAITSFVEGSVRVTLNRSLSEGLD